jgi:hypothetical protein
MYHWDASGRTAIPVLKYMAKHSLLKREQALLGLRLVETHSTGAPNQWGKQGMPDEIVQLRAELAAAISRLNHPE